MTFLQFKCTVASQNSVIVTASTSMTRLCVSNSSSVSSDTIKQTCVFGTTVNMKRNISMPLSKDQSDVGLSQQLMSCEFAN